MTGQSENAGALLKALFAVLVWGASFIAIKVALRDYSPLALIWIRFAIGLLVVGGLIALRKESLRLPLPALGRFAVLGFMGVALHQWLQVTGLVTAQASTTAWIVSTIPVFIAILGRVMLHERLGFRRTGGIALAMVGVLFVVSRGDWHALLPGRFSSQGDLLILISAPNWALFTIISRRILQRHSPLIMMFYVMLTGWLYISLLLFVGPGAAAFGGPSSGGLASVVFLGVFCTGVAYVFWYDALKILPAARLGSLLYVEPLVAVVVAAMVLQEPILVPVLLGGALILAGVWIVNKQGVI
jgi:drug/metabolite transporter (DMT)-like permease